MRFVLSQCTLFRTSECHVFTHSTTTAVNVWTQASLSYVCHHRPNKLIEYVLILLAGSPHTELRSCVKVEVDVLGSRPIRVAAPRVYWESPQSADSRWLWRDCWKSQIYARPMLSFLCEREFALLFLVPNCKALCS